MPPEAPDLSEADRIRLLHMLDAAKRAVAFAAGRQRGQLPRYCLRLHDDSHLQISPPLT